MSAEPLEATIHLAFAFDVGYEVDLEKAGAMLPVESGHLARRRRTPESIRYRPSPLRLALDASGFALPGLGEDVVTGQTRAELTLYDFGAISLLIQVPVHTTPEGLSRLAGVLADPAPITASARLVLAPWLERLRPVIVEFELSDLSEEYVVFQLGETRPGWLADHAAWVAGLVRLEPGPLGAEEVVEATRRNIAYAPNDLVVLDWAAGVVADRDCADTIQVIEFANVQLLEFRHIDDRLDDRLEATYQLMRPKARRRRHSAHDAGPAERPRAGDRGDEPLRAGRQRAEIDRRPVSVEGVRARLVAVPPRRVAAVDPQEAEDGRGRV